MKRKYKSTEFEKKMFAFMTLFGFVSIGLKLAEVIDYSWWLVTIPFWIFWAFFVGAILFAIVAGLVVQSWKVLMK